MTAREYMAMKLREYRNASNLSVNEVGEYVGRSGKTVSAWEVKRGQPDADTMVKLCVLYGVDISDFYISDEEDPYAHLTSEEKFLIADYRTLSDKDKSAISQIVYSLSIANRND